MTFICGQFFFLAPLSLCIFLLAGCTQSRVRIIPSNQNGESLSRAQIYLDGKLIGHGETDLDLGKGSAIKILVMQYPEYLPRDVVIGDWLEQRVVVTLESDPAFAETRAPGFFDLQVNQFMTFEFPHLHVSDPGWKQALLQVFENSEFPIETFELRSGLLKTSWLEKKYTSSSGQELLVRRRIQGSVLSARPLIYRLQLEVMRQEAGAEKYVSWDRVYPSDAELLLTIIQKFPELKTPLP